MSIILNKKTKNKASLSLMNQIQSYLFEQQYGEFEGYTDRFAKAFLKQLNVIVSKS